MSDPDSVDTDLVDLVDVPLSEDDTDIDPDDTLRRIIPEDGSRLLVAAAFNSAI